MKFIINAKLPSLNDYIAACRANKFQGANFKEEIETVIGWAIRQAVCKGELKATDKPHILKFTWTEANRRRDCDNICSARKFILDALQKSKIIPNDNQKYIRGFYDVFEIGEDYSVKVEFIEIQ